MYQLCGGQNWTPFLVTLFSEMHVHLSYMYIQL